MAHWVGRVGFVVAAAALIVAAGCSSDPLDSGTFQALFGTGSQNPTGIDYECVAMDFNDMSLRPTDGTCDMNSSNAGAMCGADPNCPGGACVGSASNDALGGQPIIQIDADNAAQLVNFVPGPCRTCLLSSFFQPCSSAADCPENSCSFGFCAGTDGLPIECTSDDQCPENACVDQTQTLPDAILTEDPYLIEKLVVDRLRIFDQETGTRNFCTFGDTTFDPPLTFEIGPNRSNNLRFVMDLAAMEAALSVSCIEFQNQIENILTLQD